MSDFLQQMLNDEEHNRRLTDAMNRADIEKWKELTRRLNQEELIPCTEELNRLKEFLANFKRDPEDIGQNTPFPAEVRPKARLGRCKKCEDPLFGSEIEICDYCRKVYQMGP